MYEIIFILQTIYTKLFTISTPILFGTLLESSALPPLGSTCHLLC